MAKTESERRRQENCKVVATIAENIKKAIRFEKAHEEMRKMKREADRFQEYAVE